MSFADYGLWIAIGFILAVQKLRFGHFFEVIYKWKWFQNRYLGGRSSC